MTDRPSGTSALILVADNLTTTDPEIERAVRDRDPSPLHALAELAGRRGATYLDVNLGPGRLGQPAALDFVLDTLTGAWHGGILIDTTTRATMERGAARARSWPGPVVLNGFSGDPGREFVLDLAARHGLEVVVFLMARGIPPTVDERLALALELVALCREKGIGPDRIWIDPVVAPLGWVDGQELDAGLLEVLRRLPEVLGEQPRTLIGLSNLTARTSGTRRLAWMEEVFLAAAAGAGLTHAMVNVKSERLSRVGLALDVFAGRRLFAPVELASSGR